MKRWMSGSRTAIEGASQHFRRPHDASASVVGEAAVGFRAAAELVPDLRLKLELVEQQVGSDLAAQRRLLDGGGGEATGEGGERAVEVEARDRFRVIAGFLEQLSDLRQIPLVALEQRRQRPAEVILELFGGEERAHQVAQVGEIIRVAIVVGGADQGHDSDFATALEGPLALRILEGAAQAPAAGAYQGAGEPLGELGDQDVGEWGHGDGSGFLRKTSAYSVDRNTALRRPIVLA